MPQREADYAEACSRREAARKAFDQSGRKEDGDRFHEADRVVQANLRAIRDGIRHREILAQRCDESWAKCQRLESATHNKPDDHLDVRLYDAAVKEYWERSDAAAAFEGEVQV